jgi:murein DD-endopeptidase MepM/ murein hydrolase activator NlpD
MKSSIWFLCAFLLTRVCFAGELPHAVRIKAADIFQGGVAAIRVDGADLAGMRGLLHDREIPFFSAHDGSYFALVGIDLEEKSGPREIRIQGQDKAGKPWEGRATFNVKEKAFPREEISVSPGFDRIDEATRKRIEKEQEQMVRLWMVTSQKRLWEDRFLPPIAAVITTSPFGLRRVVNGLPRTPHGGVDLKAPLGTEVIAPNHGRVILRDDFFFSGKSLVLDHGGGLYTMYFHLQDFAVEKGVQVRKGDLIAWTGMTGRITGPHLHWGARINGARIDPFGLLDIAGEKPEPGGKREGQ